MNSCLNDRRFTFSVTKKNIYIFFLRIYFLCLPLNAVTLGAMGSVLKYIAILPVGMSIISMRALRFHKLILAQLAFVVFAALSCFWSVDRDMSTDRTVSYALLTALLFSVNSFRFDGEDIKKIKKAFLWSARSTAIIMLLYSEYSGGRFILDEKVSEDPNYLCGYLLAGVIISLQTSLSEKKKILPIAELIFYLLLVLLTGSRGGLLMLACSIITYILIYKKATVAETMRKILYILLIGCALLALLQFLPEGLQERFDLKEAFESGGTGRFEIWEEGINVFGEFSLKEKMFGTGTGTITEVLNIVIDNTVKGVAMHNIFLETLLELGIVGCILYSFTIFSFAFSAFKEKDKFAFAVIAGMIILSLSTSIHTFKPYYNIMLMILVLRDKVVCQANETAVEQLG